MNAAGAVSVRLAGANPSTNYALFLRPLDDSGDLDTGIAEPTNTPGNAATGPKSFSAFTRNTTASRTFVVKHQPNVDTLEPVASGYEIH